MDTRTYAVTRSLLVQRLMESVFSPIEKPWLEGEIRDLVSKELMVHSLWSILIKWRRLEPDIKLENVARFWEIMHELQDRESAQHNPDRPKHIPELPADEAHDMEDDDEEIIESLSLQEFSRRLAIIAEPHPLARLSLENMLRVDASHSAVGVDLPDFFYQVWSRASDKAQIPSDIMEAAAKAFDLELEIEVKK